ncbi:MAG: ABC transporter substrate-binding protein [Lachnospiraceae bacterium]|nr:ABC transporter substrate-binding protein [Lachnospiraceae bacterium]
MMVGWKLFFFSLCIVCLLSGCANKKGAAEPESGAAKLDERIDNLIQVGFSQLGSESVWRSANTVSIQETLTPENGYFLIYENARQKQENQIKAIRSFISQRVDYIVFSPVVEDGWDTVLQEAKQAGIPVITSDRQIRTDDASLVRAWVGGDMFAEGEKAARWLQENSDTEEELNIVVLTGTEGSTAAVGRSDGFHSISDGMDNWHILEEQSGDFTMARGKEIMEEYLGRYDEIDVLVSQNDDMTFGAIEAMEEAGIDPGADILIISYDAVKEALEMVRDGMINVDVECSPLLGPYVDDLIKRMENGEDISPENPVEELVFTAENVETYLADRTY